MARKNSAKRFAKNITSDAKNVVPLVKKGIGKVYGTMARGINLGVKGVKKVAYDVNSFAKTKSRKIKHQRKRRHTSRRR
jgi:hypothetical protein